MMLEDVCACAPVSVCSYIKQLLMMHLIWKTGDTAVIASVMTEQLTGLIRLVKGKRAEAMV